MEVGQRFKSKSKIDKVFKEFLYLGTVQNNNEPYNHLIKNTITGDKSFIEPEWFNQRKIVLITE